MKLALEVFRGLELASAFVVERFSVITEPMGLELEGNK